MRIFIATLALLIGLTNANAQIAGQNDPLFRAALAQWLDGEDLAALTVLSGLAKADNRAAQVFLGRVDLMRHTHIHVTGDMDRKARNSLMRAGSGAFGKNWLRIAEVDTPLAAAFLNASKLNEKLGATIKLLEFQENVAAVAAVFKTMGEFQKDGYAAISEVVDHSSRPIHLQNYIYSTQDFWTLGNGKLRDTDPSIAALSKAERAKQDAFNWPMYSWFELVHGKINASDIDPYIVNNPVFAPLQNLCSEACGGDVPKCMRTLNGTPIGGVMWLKLSSPAETILPNDDYQSSARISDDLKRLLRTTGVQQDWFDSLKRYDQCAYQAVFAE